MVMCIMVLRSPFVLGEDVQVAREDDAVINVVGKISYSVVDCICAKWGCAGHKARYAVIYVVGKNEL